MIVNLWVELDNDGAVLRASDGVRQHLAAALARRAGRVRVALGHGATMTQLDLEVAQGALGARCVLFEAPEIDTDALVGRWAVAAQDGVILTDADGHILWTNQRFCELVGYSNDEVTGRYLSVFRSSRTPERRVHALTRALVGKGAWTGAMVFRRSNGTEMSAWASYTAIRDGHDATTHHVVVVSDQTEQEELERLESLDASASLIGRLSRGFAHDINNLAGALNTALSALKINAPMLTVSSSGSPTLMGSFALPRITSTVPLTSAAPPMLPRSSSSDASAARSATSGASSSRSPPTAQSPRLPISAASRGTWAGCSAAPPRAPAPSRWTPPTIHCGWTPRPTRCSAPCCTPRCAP